MILVHVGCELSMVAYVNLDLVAYVNLDLVAYEGFSQGRDNVGQHALPNRNQRTARIKWRKVVNVV